jgi:hypothetical protein
MAGIALKNGLFNSGLLIAGKGNSTCDCTGSGGATGVLGGKSGKGKGDGPGEEGDNKGEEGEEGGEEKEEKHGEGGKEEAKIGLERKGPIKSSEEVANELSSKKEAAAIAAEESAKEDTEVEAGGKGGKGG